MWMRASAGRAPKQRSRVLGLTFDPEAGGPPQPDAGPAAVTPAALPVPRAEATPSPRPAVAAGMADVEDQLRRLAVRLLAEAGGDPAMEGALRRHLDASCARFATARVRQFVPILVEREVRRRLREEEQPA